MMISYTQNNQIAFKKWFIGNDIRKILMKDSGITEMVGSDIYPLIAPENTQGDFILYGREKYSKEADMNKNVVLDICIVSVSVIADNYDNAIKIASMIDNALTGKHINDKGDKFRMELNDSTETFSDNKYIETLLFRIY